MKTKISAQTVLLNAVGDVGRACLDDKTLGEEAGGLLYPSGPKERLMLAHNIIEALETGGYKFSKKITKEQEILSYSMGNLIVGFEIDDPKGLWIHYERIL